MASIIPYDKSLRVMRRLLPFHKLIPYIIFREFIIFLTYRHIPE